MISLDVLTCQCQNWCVVLIFGEYSDFSNIAKSLCYWVLIKKYVYKVWWFEVQTKQQKIRSGNALSCTYLDFYNNIYLVLLRRSYL